jgi:hypothetical protein
MGKLAEEKRTRFGKRVSTNLFVGLIGCQKRENMNK